MDPKKVLVLGDAPARVRILSTLLKSCWKNVDLVTAATQWRDIEWMRNERPDVVVAGLASVDGNAGKLLDQARRFSPAPIIFVNMDEDWAVIGRKLAMEGPDGARDASALPDLLMAMGHVEEKIHIRKTMEEHRRKVAQMAQGMATLSQFIREYMTREQIAPDDWRVLLQDLEMVSRQATVLADAPLPVDEGRASNGTKNRREEAMEPA